LSDPASWFVSETSRKICFSRLVLTLSYFETVSGAGSGMAGMAAAIPI